jgi:hypothetical protein
MKQVGGGHSSGRFPQKPISRWLWLAEKVVLFVGESCIILRHRLSYGVVSSGPQRVREVKYDKNSIYLFLICNKSITTK